jgi:segregation and condensation protein B
MENIDRIRSIIEALLIVSEGGLSAEDLKNAINDADVKDINEGIKLLKEEYDSPKRAFNIAEIAGRYRIVTKPEYMPWIGNLYKKEVDRLTGPSLETLAILAYKQPATRAEIESVRGVNVGGVLKALLEKDLIQVKGRKEVIGRPLLYATTGKFLEIFGLNSLEDLPILRDFTEEDLEYGKPQEIVEVDDEQLTADSSRLTEDNAELESTDDSQQSTGSMEQGAGSVEHEEENNTQYSIPNTGSEDAAEQAEEAQEDIEDTDEELPEAERIETSAHEEETITEANQETEIAEEEAEVSEEELNTQYTIPNTDDSDTKESNDEAEKA